MGQQASVPGSVLPLATIIINAQCSIHGGKYTAPHANHHCPTTSGEECDHQFLGSYGPRHFLGLVARQFLGLSCPRPADRAVAASSGPLPLEVQLRADRAVVLAPQSEQTSNTKGRKTLNSCQSQKEAQQKERDTLNFGNLLLAPQTQKTNEERKTFNWKISKK